jgi:Mn-containing catalase
MLRWSKGVAVFFHVQKLINPIVDDKPDPAAANALQEGLGGQFSEMRTLRRALIGSVSDSVVKHAHCPVLVVRQ